MEILITQNLISAGFASPAEEYKEDRLDLKSLIVRHPANTIIISNPDNDSEIFVVDKSIKPRFGVEVFIQSEDEYSYGILVKDDLGYSIQKGRKTILDFIVIGIITFKINLYEQRFRIQLINTEIDELQSMIIQNPISTFFVKVKGDSMFNAGIYEGDILIVDRSYEPQLNKIIVAYTDQGFTVKRLEKMNGEFFLVPENDRYKPVKVSSEDQNFYWGTVIGCISKKI
jgi:hypothetical protein